MAKKEPGPSNPEPVAGSVARELAEREEARRTETPAAPAARVLTQPAKPIPTPGRIVLYRIPPRDPGHPGDPEADPPIPARPASVDLRPAVVTMAFGGDAANLRVFLDYHNDVAIDLGRRFRKANLTLIGAELHETSVCEGSDVGQWRWPPRA